VFVSAPVTEPASSTLFLGGISYAISDLELQSFLRRMGVYPRRVELGTDRESGRSKGYAFVEMDTPAAAADALTVLSGCELAGRELRVDFARPRTGSASPRPEGRPR
jgi:RNA recognition motif-containing protein